MKIFFRYLAADYIKTKQLPIRLIHLLIPAGIAVLFLVYYSYSPWNVVTKLAVYFQALGIGFPFIIGLISVMAMEQEISAGACQVMLTASNRLIMLFSKLFLLVLFGLFSSLFSSGIFALGNIYILKQNSVESSFYWEAAIIMIGCTIVLYVWHLFLALKFNKGLSIGIGLIESLASAILLTGLGDSTWMYIPCAWASRFVTILTLVYSGRKDNLFMSQINIGVKVCLFVTFLSLIIVGIWFKHWDGQKSYD